MRKKELLEEIENLYVYFISMRKGSSQQSMNHKDAALDAEDEDEADLNDLQAIYYSMVEDAASLAFERLIDLEYRIKSEGRIMPIEHLINEIVEDALSEARKAKEENQIVKDLSDTYADFCNSESNAVFHVGREFEDLINRIEGEEEE